jgi:hypothetical protein
MAGLYSCSVEILNTSWVHSAQEVAVGAASFLFLLCFQPRHSCLICSFLSLSPSLRLSLFSAGKYTGFCDLGASWQTLESSDHKAALGLAPGTHGVYVTAVEPCYPASLVSDSFGSCLDMLVTRPDMPVASLCPKVSYAST